MTDGLAQAGALEGVLQGAPMPPPSPAKCMERFRNLLGQASFPPSPGGSGGAPTPPGGAQCVTPRETRALLEAAISSRAIDANMRRSIVQVRASATLMVSMISSIRRVVTD